MISPEAAREMLALMRRAVQEASISGDDAWDREAFMREVWIYAKAEAAFYAEEDAADLQPAEMIRQAQQRGAA